MNLVDEIVEYIEKYATEHSLKFFVSEESTNKVRKDIIEIFNKHDKI